MTRTALLIVACTLSSCASPARVRPRVEPRPAAPPATPAGETPPETIPEPVRPEPPAWAIANIEGRQYECTLGAWRPGRAPSGAPVVARVTRQGSLETESSASVEWRGRDERGAFSVRRGRVPWPASDGVRADASVLVSALAATRHALVVREDPADHGSRVLIIPATGSIAVAGRPGDAPFDLAAVLVLPDGAIALQWAASLRDVVTVLEPDGRLRATRAFDWRTEGHGVLRSLARAGGRVGLAVEEPAAESVMQVHDLDPAAAAGPRLPLPRPLRLSPCVGDTPEGAFTLADGWLAPSLSSPETLPPLSSIVELGPSGTCLRTVTSHGATDGTQAAVALAAVDARTLAGVLDDGRRTREVRCLLPEGSVAPPPTPAAPSASAAGGAGSVAACAEVHIGLDLRALPTSTSASGIELFVRGEADDLARAAPPGAPPQIRLTPGASVFDAVFHGSAAADVLARCERTVAAYLPTAPRLPVLMEPAAQVITTCRPCAP